MKAEASASGSSAPVETLWGIPILVASEPMRKLLQYASRVAKTDALVLITGESGTGKELVARAIHHHSMRCAKPWVDVNCGALPEHLVESELFGYEKGAFSGADQAKRGLFELADTGTLFLDEIGELDAKTQVKLLRILDGTPYYRLGGLRKVSPDVRIVAATNQNLVQAVAAGRFRKDLYHRLDQLTIQVPPLRERPADILPLAEFFLKQHNPTLRLSEEVRKRFLAHPWPGNVRELRNTVIKAAMQVEGAEIRELHLAEALRLDSPQASAGPVGRLDEMERRMILEVLSQTDGHHERAAELLGISSRTLTRKLKSYRMGHVPEPAVA
jgi:transcriptional regulator with PAS, ATPase and Fis domain